MWKIVTKVFKDWRIFPKAIITAYIFRVLVEIISSIIPLISKNIVDQIEVGYATKSFYTFIILFFIVSIIDPILTKISEAKKFIFKEYFFAEKNAQIYRKIFEMDYQQYIDEGTGKLLKKIERGIESQWHIFDLIYQSSTVALIRFSISIFVIFLYLPGATSLLILGILFLLWLARATQVKSLPIYEKVKDIREEASRQESKMIMEKQLINLSGKASNELLLYKNILHPLKSLSWKADFWGSLPYDGMLMLFRFIEAIGYITVGWQIWYHTSTFGDIVLIVGCIWQLRWPFEILANGISEWSKHKARYNSLQKFINTQSTIIDGTKEINITNGTISYNNIVFGYKIGLPIIQGLSLKIQGGKTTAFIGHSGSGKSTLIKLLLRYYDPLDGSITIDGQNLITLSKQSWYKEVGYLPQEPSIFDGTIKENLLYGVDASQIVSEDDMWGALKMAQIDSHIRSLPMGLETEIGEKGVKLSGGEKQRLAIARVFLKNPKILILDEPTSALDSISEHAITKIMKELFANRTVIIIAHRLQTVMHADTIVVLDHGKIVQQGNHEELLYQEGVYKKLVNLQKGTIDE